MKSKESLIVTLIALLLFAFTSVGYAIYSVENRIEGQGTFAKNGKVQITSAILTDNKNLDNIEDPTFEDTTIHFNLNFNVPRTEEALQDEYYATYAITISNNSFYDSIFEASHFNPSLSTINNEDMDVSYELEGIEMGDTISSLTATTLTLKIMMTPNNTGEFNVSGDTEFEVVPTTEAGRLLGSIPKNITGELKNTTASILLNASVMNTYETSKKFHITVSNDNFYLVDENGNELEEFTIEGNTTEEYPIYLKVKSTARFASEKQSLNIYFEPVGEAKSSMGVVVVEVKKDETLIDLEPPTISNVVGEFQATKGSIKVSYQGEDNVAIDHYKIETYQVVDGVATLVKTDETVADEEEFIVTGLADGSYYFQVTAYDTSNQTSTDQSATQEYIWTMNVRINITQGGPNGRYTVNYGETFTTTITANDNRNIPRTLTITMGENTLSANEYSYNNGYLQIPNVTGDVVVTGETTGGINVCLVEGTKVRLADNTVKKIEDIHYDDLLKVWSYDTGSTTMEYPIWIETPKTSKQYTKISFSDQSEIKIVGGHAFFSVDQKKFVKANDPKDFYIGTRIRKVDEKGNLVTVKVTNIETIQEPITYYFVASTRYYNIISDDFITTDAYTDITNLYSFNENIQWQNKIVEELPYEYLKDFLPYYMYKGFRAGELSILLQDGKTSLEEFKQYVEVWVTSDFMMQKPIEKEGNRYWPVSIRETEKQYIKEGDTYQLPEEGIWYSTSENKYYMGGEKVPVWTGMHFIKQ